MIAPPENPTTMKAITGTLGLNAGDIEYMGKSIKGQGPWDLVRQGLAMVPEGRGVFARMTIMENLQMGAYVRKDQDAIEADAEKVFTIFPRLRERREIERGFAGNGFHGGAVCGNGARVTIGENAKDTD